MRSFTIGDLALITSNQPVNNILLQTPIEGLDSPEVRSNYTPKPGEDGGRMSSLLYDKRPISLKGTVWGNNATEFEAARKAIFRACAINRDSNGYPQATRIAYTTMAGNAYFVDGFFDRPIIDYDDTPNVAEFFVNMTAVDPFIYGATQVSSGLITRPSGGGFVLPVVLPIVSAGSTGGRVNLINDGDAYSLPMIELIGPLTNPYILNQTTGKSMQLNYTIPAGSTVTIDMAQKIILLNGNSPLISAKESASDWWGLRPDSNLITFNTGSTSDTGTMEITFYPAWIGT